MAATPPGAIKPAGFNDIREYLAALEEAGLLKHITAEVDPEYELGAICSRSLQRGGPALIFENVKGYPGMPLVANLLSSTRHLALAFGTDEREEAVYDEIVLGMQNRVPSAIRETGPCKEEIYRGDEVDLYKFPTPVWHELDGGPYIGTTAGIITRDPKTGNMNMGSYRCEIKDKNTIAMSPAKGDPRDPSGGDHMVTDETEGRPAPVAIALGMDPYLSLATGTPVPADEESQTEFEAAGAWRRAPTELVRCETNDLLVPANAEIILEGELVRGVRTEEGPHGESTGFYGENKQGLVIRIDCVTHRHNPVSYGLICQLIEDYPRSLLRSGSIQTALLQKTGMTNIRQAYFPEVGRLGMLIVSAEIHEPDEPRRIMEAIWELGRWRWVIVVDEDCDVRDWNDVMWRVVSLAEPTKGDVIQGHVLERRNRARGEVDFDPPTCGMGIDATMRFKDAKFPPVNKVSRELMSRVASRWKDLGLD